MEFCNREMLLNCLHSASLGRVSSKTVSILAYKKFAKYPGLPFTSEELEKTCSKMPKTWFLLVCLCMKVSLFRLCMCFRGNVSEIGLETQAWEIKLQSFQEQSVGWCLHTGPERCQDADVEAGRQSTQRV